METLKIIIQTIIILGLIIIFGSQLIHDLKEVFRNEDPE